MNWIKNPNLPASDLTNVKAVYEVVYTFADHRPTASTPLVGEAFLIDEEQGDQFISTPEGDMLRLTQKRKDLPPVTVTITVPRGSYLYREERRYVRKRLDSEPPPPA